MSYKLVPFLGRNTCLAIGHHGIPMRRTGTSELNNERLNRSVYVTGSPRLFRSQRDPAPEAKTPSELAWARAYAQGASRIMAYPGVRTTPLLRGMLGAQVAPQGNKNTAKDKAGNKGSQTTFDVGRPLHRCWGIICDTTRLLE